MLTLLTLLLLGSLRYFLPEYKQLWWLAYAIGIFMFLPGSLSYIKNNTFQQINFQLLFLLLIMLSATLIALPPIAQVLVALKSLLPFASIWLILNSQQLSNKQIQHWLIGLLTIGLAQSIMTLYQYTIIRSGRLALGNANVNISDSVVGTFGGNMEGGGLSGSLALFLVMCIVASLSFYRQQQIRRPRLIILLLLLFLSLILMEVKIIFFYLPVALFILYRADFRYQPLKLLRWISLIIGLFILLFITYQSLHWSVRSNDIDDNILRGFSYSFQESATQHKLDIGIMSRRQILEFWWQENSIDQPAQLFLGHGIGASRTTGIFMGEIGKKYSPLKLDRTGISIILWDFGILGFIAFSLLIWQAYHQAKSLAQQSISNTWEAAVAHSLYAFFPLVFMSILYRNDFPYTAPSMFMLMSAFGLISWLTQHNQYASKPVMEARSCTTNP